jgi:hypothetical protein
MQAEHEGEGLPRRRRPPREAALAALNLLQGLQKTLLVTGTDDGTQDLLAAAEEVESIGASADPALARLCAALSTRLRVELAKRGVEDEPGP